MQWVDKAIITNIRKYGENSSIVTVLTENYGLYSGMVKSITSRKSSSVYQIGNIVEIEWKARISEHLGMFKAEILTSITSLIMFDYMKLLALRSLCSLVTNCLGERIAEKSIYNISEEFLVFLKDNDQNWLRKYILFELRLLAELGFGLDLDECVVTKSKDKLKYISPKSGKAVSEAAAIPYTDKLFKLPLFFIDKHISPSIEDMQNALNITGYFLNKFLISINKSELPKDRILFINNTIK